MVSFWSKLDPGLASIYSDYIDLRDLGPARAGRVAPVVASGGPLTLTLHHEGDLEAIEALGFHTIARETPRHATGTVGLADIERVAAHPDVIALIYGSPHRVALDESTANVSAKLVRAWDPFDNEFTPSGPATGKGAIVGIIDTGIDFRHPYFDAGPFIGLDPPPARRKTRILKIWDQTLTPDGVTQNSPNKDHLTGGESYGVEYTRAMIEAFLNSDPGAARVHHRDSDVHGTHVASIAAGNGRNDFRYIGIAPEADLVVVKLLALSGDGGAAGKDFRDAVSYILKVAETEHLPVVINYSAGSDLRAHDGFDVNEDFLTSRFPDTAVGRCFVVASGNARNKRQHARIVLAANVEIAAPFELIEQRAVADGSTLFIELYYPSGPVVSVKLETPLGGMLVGPALNDEKSRTFRRFRCKLRHAEQKHILVSGAQQTIVRNLITVEIKPAGKRHRAGVYKVHLKSDRATTIHAWCEQLRKDFQFRVDADPLPAGVTDANEELIGPPGGSAGVITVGAYSAEGDKKFAEFSSSGPLVNYDYTADIRLLQAKKPEIIAPGVDIDAARSRDDKSPVTIPGLVCRTAQHSGTSMAAPHVTGAIALMLAKNPNLTVAQIRTKLLTAASDDNDPNIGEKEVGAGRLDVQAAFIFA